MIELVDNNIIGRAEELGIDQETVESLLREYEKKIIGSPDTLEEVLLEVLE